MTDCGLFHNAVVWLELEDGFGADRNALIALREATGPSRITTKIPGWSHLESFTSPGQLATCGGVKVHNGRVTELDLIYCGLTGTISLIIEHH